MTGLRTIYRSLESSQGSLLDSIEQEAEGTGCPSYAGKPQPFKDPGGSLETGPYIGDREPLWDTLLLMCRVMPENCRITTIEKYEKRIPAAREHFKIAGEEGRITLLEGDADDLLAGLKGQTFDLVFMDAAKGQYLHWLPMILALMPEGGSSYRTMYFRTEISWNPDLQWSAGTGPSTAGCAGISTSLSTERDWRQPSSPIGDGVAVSTKYTERVE